MNVRPDRSYVALRLLDCGISSDTHLSFGESPLMDMQDRVFYAAARAQMMAAKAKWSRAGHPPHWQASASKADHSTQAAINHRYEMAKARCAVQMIYAKHFEESQHPRAPAGTRNGGQFVKANGAAKTDTFYISTLLNRLQDERQLAQSAPDQLTLAELTAKLHGHLQTAERATTAEVRAREIAAATQVQQVLTARDFSDDNAPLAVKERIWKAHQRYQVLFYEYRRAEEGLATWKRWAPTDKKLLPLFEQRLAQIKAEMQQLANVTGARLPANNPIRDWSFEQKFLRAAEIALESGDLAPEVAAQLMAAIEPANLARTAAMMATLAAAHAYPVAGLAADAVLLGYVGTDGALVAYRLYLEVSSIQSEADLHEAARILNQELAAQTAGKLIQLLTWGAGKGTAAFNKRYKFALDHAKVKRLSNGSMPLSPNPAHLIPLKIQRRTPKPKTFGKATRRFGSLSDRDLTSRIRATPKDNNPSSVANQLRYERYYRTGGKMKFDEWFPASRGARKGGPVHQAIQQKLHGDAPNAKTEVTFGDRVADVFWPKNPKTGSPTLHQIGDVNPSRVDPIARERLAIQDLVDHLKAEGKMNHEIWFWDKGNPKAAKPLMKIKVSTFPPSDWIVP